MIVYDSYIASYVAISYTLHGYSNIITIAITNYSFPQPDIYLNMHGISNYVPLFFTTLILCIN